MSQLKYDPVKLFPDAGKYNEFMELTHTKKFDELTRDEQFLSLLINKLNYNIPTPQQQLLSKNWLMDYDEMLLVDRSRQFQSPVSLYTQEKPDARPEDDVIVIRPKFNTITYNLYVCQTGRARTMYDTVSLMAQFISLVGHVDPLPKRSFTSVLVFNERLNLKRLFVPVEVLEQAESEYKQQVYNGKIVDKGVEAQSNQSLYDIVVAKLRRMSSRDKFAKVKVQEDYNAGECNVCNTRYESYKHHINHPDHIRNFRNYLLQGENMIMALIHHQNNFELVQAINTQFNAAACTLMSEFNCSWRCACTAINEAIRAVGGTYQLDVDDAPRANSPNCKTNSFARWREDICLRRQGVLESVLTSSSARKSGYKRIKSAAGSFAMAAFACERFRRG